jgi:hypothetical protein
MLNALLGHGGVIFFPARRSSLLAEYTLFQVARSATNRRIKSAIKCRGILGIDMDDACWARDEDSDGRGPSSCGATACRLRAALDDSPRIERLLIAIVCCSQRMFNSVGGEALMLSDCFWFCCHCGHLAVNIPRNEKGEPKKEKREGRQRRCSRAIGSLSQCVSPTWSFT